MVPVKDGDPSLGRATNRTFVLADVVAGLVLILIIVVIVIVSFPDQADSVVGLVEAVVWPVVAGAALIKYHRSLSGFLDGISHRVTKVSFFQVAFELSEAREFAPAWSGPSLADVRQLTPADEFSSGAMALFEQMAGSTVYDYAVIDLGEGDQWLTSRLFIFAIMLQRQRGLRCFVFLETTAGVRRRFLGTAPPDRVRWALARRYPWLEQAFAEAYAEGVAQHTLSMRGGLEPPWAATQLVAAFLRRIQEKDAPAASGSDSAEWVTMKDPGGHLLREHAKWLTGARLERVLGSTLQASWVPDSPDAPPAEQARAVLRRQGAFVAVVEEGRRFRSLVDRQALLEQAATRLAQQPDDRTQGLEQQSGQ